MRYLWRYGEITDPINPMRKGILFSASERFSSPVHITEPATTKKLHITIATPICITEALCVTD